MSHQPVDPPSMESLLASMRTRIESAARPFSHRERLDALLADAAPFVESASRVQTRDELSHSAAWTEARSLVWLLGYRLGDQDWPAPLVSSIVPAWRDAMSAPWVLHASDELMALLLDGYARGREDRMKAHSQKALADAQPVLEVTRGVVLAMAVGELEPDSARAFADRASTTLLRRDARAVVLDVSSLVHPTAAVLNELWTLAPSARMLGVRVAVSGVTPELGEALKQAGIADEGELRTIRLEDALTAALDWAGVSMGTRAGAFAWMKKLFGDRERR